MLPVYCRKGQHIDQQNCILLCVNRNDGLPPTSKVMADSLRDRDCHTKGSLQLTHFHDLIAYWPDKERLWDSLDSPLHSSHEDFDLGFRGLRNILNGAAYTNNPHSLNFSQCFRPFSRSNVMALCETLHNGKPHFNALSFHRDLIHATRLRQPSSQNLSAFEHSPSLPCQLFG